MVSVQKRMQRLRYTPVLALAPMEINKVTLKYLNGHTAQRDAQRSEQHSMLATAPTEIDDLVSEYLNDTVAHEYTQNTG